MVKLQYVINVRLRNNVLFNIFIIQIIAEKMTFLLELPDNIKLWMALGVSGLGFLMIFPQIVLWLKKTKCDGRFCISLQHLKKYDKLDLNNIDVSINLK